MTNDATNFRARDRMSENGGGNGLNLNLLRRVAAGDAVFKRPLDASQQTEFTALQRELQILARAGYLTITFGTARTLQPDESVLSCRVTESGRRVLDQTGGYSGR